MLVGDAKKMLDEVQAALKVQGRWGGGADPQPDGYTAIAGAVGSQTKQPVPPASGRVVMSNAAITHLGDGSALSP